MTSEQPPIFGDGSSPPEITYPTQWSYHVIGADPDAMRSVIVDAIGAAEHAWDGGAESRGGRWHSLRVKVTVTDEPHRHRILAALQDSDAIRMVL